MSEMELLNPCSCAKSTAEDPPKLVIREERSPSNVLKLRRNSLLRCWEMILVVPTVYVRSVSCWKNTTAGSATEPPIREVSDDGVSLKRKKSRNR